MTSMSSCKVHVRSECKVKAGRQAWTDGQFCVNLNDCRHWPLSDRSAEAVLVSEAALVILILFENQQFVVKCPAMPAIALQ